ncbi:MAG: F0F1 ATP synthase subunit delta [Massilibacteroides sp.]|nr:F0F1 ATP synthase subunit delta [Massilibacteroides sp.]MDD3063655.1 F0F1 ATP synthase subunit delta [Massilibacteroides sp.]MDD4114789.1 F0F1 ATP synthase subunit delta [Massilibacteroides sp.]MDD4661194.1 F0F1 ATP synthase subunit delta [Massilibacteroides sp.]
MDRGIIAGRYAKALFKYAGKRGKEHEIYQETRWLAKSMTRYPQVKRILSSPIIPQSKKQSMLEQLFATPPSKEIRRFIQLVLEKKREEILQAICFMYQEYYREANNILQVELVTVSPIPDNTKNRIIAQMGKLTREQIRLVTTVDPEIQGGYVLYWDTYRWDASITSRIRSIKNKINEKMNNII